LYEKVEIGFIAHHTEAKEVTEEDFFNRGESGGHYLFVRLQPEQRTDVCL
jgi:uncharacterized sporulation protein YeaH/YhbH (DUF444 family)